MADYALMADGSIKRVDGALIPADDSNADYRSYQAWLAGGGIPDAYEPPAAPAPGTVAPALIASAFAISISGGDIAAMDGVFNLGAGLYLGAGQYMLFFIEPQPDADYFAQAMGDAPCLIVTDRQPEYLMIEARDGAAGALVDAGTISVQAFRF